MTKLFSITLSFLLALQASAQSNTPVQYVAMYKDLAIREMKRMGVPAAITLAQGILESECGNSDLVKQSNNHFGIKCKSTWTGDAVKHDDDAIGECFRKYATAEDSYRDHSNFLRGNTRYSGLFKLDVTDYKAWATGLKRAGYATNPRYPEILIRNIEQYNLQQYTLAALDSVANYDASKYEDDSAATVPVTTVPIEMPKPGVENKSVLDEPDKKIYINGSKCVFVKKGTSLLILASKNDINLNKILAFNELAEDGILGKDQYIFLQKKSRTGDQPFYIVEEGESLYDVAQKNGIQLQYLMDYNGLVNTSRVEAGTKLLLKPAPKQSVQNTPTAKLSMHTVAPKEGLYSIAKKYNVTVQQLKDWNNLQSNDLQIGQKLIVSQ